jgi:hypothetical protein
MRSIDSGYRVVATSAKARRGHVERDANRDDGRQEREKGEATEGPHIERLPLVARGVEDALGGLLAEDAPERVTASQMQQQHGSETG